MMQEHDHPGGTSHLAFFVVVLLAFALIAAFGFTIFPTRETRTDTAKSDGAKVERAPSPTAGTDKPPVTDKTPAR